MSDEQAGTVDAGQVEKKRLMIFFPYRGKVVRADVVHPITWADEDEAEAFAPTPMPPFVDGSPQFSDPNFLRERSRAIAEQRLFLVARALGPAFCGGADDMKDRIDYLKRTYTHAAMQQAATAIENPTEATETEVQQEMARLFPTSPAPMVGTGKG